MSLKQLDFSKHNLIIDLAEVKKMFEMHFNKGCRYLVKQAFEKITETRLGKTKGHPAETKA